MRNSPRTLLVLLTTLNFVNYLDRYEMAAVLETVRRDMALSNLQAGLLGTIFLASFLVTAPIFGALGDRLPRKNLLLFGAIVWSLATVATGFARSVPMLFLARAFVGVGEASFTTLAPTVIDDVAPEERRTRWLAIFHIAAPVGSALGYIVGGAVAQHWGWHAAFFVGGLPGLILGVMVLASHEPERRSSAKAFTGSFVQTTKALFGERDYRMTVLGYVAQTFAVGAFAFWAPAFLLKRFGASLAKANFTFGLVTVVAGLLATLCGGWVGDRWQNAAEAKERALPTPPPDPNTYRDNAKPALDVEARVVVARNRALLRVSAAAALPAALLSLACFLAPSQPIFFVLAFLTEFGVFFSNAPINAALLRTVPPELRGRGMAYAIVSIHLFGDLWSPALIGLLADYFGDVQIQFAVMPLPLAFGAAGVVWLLGSRGSLVAARTEAG